MAAEIVHDHDIARSEGGQKELLDIEGKGLTVDRAVYDARGIDAIVSQGCQERHGFPVAEGGFCAQSLTARAPSSQGCHVRFGPGLINKDKALRMKAALILSPLLPAPSDAGSILLAGHETFF